MPNEDSFIVQNLKSVVTNLDKLDSTEVANHLRTVTLALIDRIKAEDADTTASSALMESIKADRSKITPMTIIIALGALSFYSVILWNVLIISINHENEGKYIPSDKFPRIEKALEIVDKYNLNERESFKLEDKRLYEAQAELSGRLKSTSDKLTNFKEQDTTYKSKQELLHAEIWRAIGDKGIK